MKKYFTKNILTKNKNFSLFLYKISVDTLILLLISFSLAFLADSILPGIISNHLSFLKFFFTIIINLLLISYLAIQNEISFPLTKTKKFSGLTFLLLIFTFLVLLVSLRKFFPIEIAVIGVTSAAIIFYFHKTLIREA